MNTKKREKNFIDIISSNLRRSELQHNGLHESDAEIVMFGEEKMLLNVDEFSCEDMFRTDNPYVLGWNMALGGISDIIATGGTPTYYLHSMTVAREWDEKFVNLLSLGVADALKRYGAHFCGGDFGVSDEWRYTAVVVGRCGPRHLLRSGACEGDAIYLTGKIGAGNLEAFLNIYQENPLTRILRNRFHVRLDEGDLIAAFANCCIDTSDGLFNSLNNISQMSNTGYEVGGIPYITSGRLLVRMASFDHTLLFFGEAGEYELLFTVSPDREEAFLEEAKRRRLQFTRIGRITSPETKILHEGGTKIDLGGYGLSARDFPVVKDYVRAVKEYLETYAS